MNGHGEAGTRRRLVANTGWNLLDGVAGILTGAIGSILVARGLGPDLLGRYQYIVWIGAIVATMTTFGVSSALGRYVGRAIGLRDHKAAGEAIQSAFRIQGIVVAVVIVVLAVLIRVAVPDGERTIAVLAWVSIPLGLLMSIPTSINGVEERFDRNVRSSLVAAVVELGTVLITLHYGWGLLGLASSVAIGRTVDCAMRLLSARHSMGFYLRHATGAPDPELARGFREMALQGFGLQALNAIVLNRSEVFFLRAFSGPAEIAYFSLALGIIRYISVLPSAMLKTVTPRIYISHARDAAAGSRLVLRSVRLKAILLAPAFGAVVVHGPWIIQLLYGPRYSAVPLPLAILAVSSVPTLGVMELQVLIRAADRQLVLVKWTAAMIIATLALDLAFIPLLGATGAALAFASSRYLYLIGVQRIADRAVSSAPMRAPRWRFILLALVAMGVPAVLLAPVLPAGANAIISGAAGTVLYALCLWRSSWLTSEERSLARQLIDRVGSHVRRALA